MNESKSSPQQPNAPTSPAATQRARQTISLIKAGHTFCFRYEQGEENTVLDALADMAKRRELPFDWFDAAVLSHQVGQHLSKELQAFLPKKAA